MKYLNSIPYEWIINESDSVVKFNALKYLNSDIQIQILNDSTDYLKYSSESCNNGILGNCKNYDLIYTGTVWKFLESISFGFTSEHSFVSRTADFIFNNMQSSDGGFSLNWHPMQSIGCRTGNILSAMIDAGINDERVEKGISWIYNNQREDGGWLNCSLEGFSSSIKLALFNRSSTMSKDRSVKSCPVASFACLNTILKTQNANVQIIEKALNFFIKNNFFYDIKFDKCVQCGQHGNFKQLGLSLMTQFNYLDALSLFSHNYSMNHPELKKFLNIILSEQNVNGSWTALNKSPGCLKEGNRTDKLLTIKILSVLRKFNIFDKNYDLF